MAEQTREQILKILTSEGVITDDQANQIRDWTGEDASKKRILGLVAGALDTPPKRIADALSGTKYATPQTQIEAQGPGAGELAEDVGEGLSKWKSVGKSAYDYLNWWGNTAIGYGREALAGADPLFGQDTRKPTSDYGIALSGLVEELEADGSITETQAKRYRLGLEYFDRDKVSEIHNELVPLISEDRAADLDEKRTEFIGEAEKFQRNYAPGYQRDVDTTDPQMHAVAEQLLQRGAESRRLSDTLSTNIPADTWLNALSQAGLISYDEEGNIQRAAQPAPILGSETYIDPATGRIYSQQMIEQYRDDIIRATSAGVNPDVAAAAANRIFDLTGTPYWRDPDTGEYGRAGRAVRNAGYDPDTGYPIRPGGTLIPAEDLGIRTLIPDDPWEQPLAQYQVGQAAFMWDQMSGEKRRSWTDMMLRYGAISPEDADYVDPTGAEGAFQVGIIEDAMKISQARQVDLEQAIQWVGGIATQNRRAQARIDGVAKAFSVPASLRKIPGEKTLAVEAKERFSRILGREVTDGELESLVPELRGYYKQSTEQQIALAYAAWEGTDPGLLTGDQLEQVEDPGAALTYDIEEKWGPEINLNARRESNSDTFNRVLNATMGGTPSIGMRTAAVNVNRIGGVR